MEDNIKEIQKELIQLLSIFDALCCKSGVHYTLHGGTLLGAIRNGGFIPWDDDADVAMLRSEFKKLLNHLATEKLPCGVNLDLTLSQRPMLWLRRKNKPPVWIDLFIYDFISEKKIFQKLKISFSIFSLALTKTPQTIEIFRKGIYYFGLRKIVIEAIYHLGSFFPMKSRIKWINYCHEHILCGNKSRIYRSNDQYIGLIKVIDYCLMSGYKKIRFENLLLEVTDSYHQVLISCYGQDYLTPKKDSIKCIEAHRSYRGFK